MSFAGFFSERIWKGVIRQFHSSSARELQQNGESRRAMTLSAAVNSEASTTCRQSIKKSSSLLNAAVDV